MSLGKRPLICVVFGGGAVVVEHTTCEATSYSRELFLSRALLLNSALLS
jgi:hypothetical protein